MYSKHEKKTSNKTLEGLVTGMNFDGRGNERRSKANGKGRFKEKSTQFPLDVGQDRRVHSV